MNEIKPGTYMKVDSFKNNFLNKVSYDFCRHDHLWIGYNRDRYKLIEISRETNENKSVKANSVYVKLSCCKVIKFTAIEMRSVRN